MALNYLLCPTFQVINTGGKPATGGYIECYIHGTRDKYYCYSDWEGTLHPFQIPLDSLGANIVLADEQNSYDVYIYNRYGSLLMSRYKVKPSGGGGIASITSSDGSINVNYTENGIDLTLADDKASCLKAGAQNLSADGIFTWFKKESVGDSIHCDQGFIVLDDGWYHFTATVRLDWRQIPVNETGRITLSTTLTSDVMEFDYSFAHDETFELSGDIYIAPSSTQYIQSGRGFVLSVMGMKTGMVAEMVGLDIHTIVGQGAAGGEKNVHRLLRWYTNASEADEQHPAGDWLHDLDSEDPDDPSGHPMVTADQLFAWYDAGQNFELYEVDGNNGQLGWSAIYRMVTWQDQSDWWSQFAPTPGKACRLEFFRMGMYSTPYRGGLIAYIRYKDEDYMRLYEIMPGQSIWMAEYQKALPYYSSDWHDGDFLRVKQDGSDLEWVPLSGVAISGSYNDLSDVPANLVQDADYVHTDNNFTDGDKSKLDGIEAGAEVNVQSNWTESDSSSDSFIQNKPSTKRVYAGQNISITEDANGFTISADGYTQEQADWNESDSSAPSFIKNKPTIPTATSDLTNDSGFITLSDVPAQVNADWDSNSGASEILNKPDLSIYAETANLATVATTGDYDDLANKPTIPAAQVNSDWNSNSGVSQILNKPSLSTVATTGDYNDLSNKPSIPAAQVNADWNSSSGVSEILNKPSLAAVATSGDYSDLSNTPSIPTATSDLTNDSGFITLSDVPAQVNADWNSDSGASEILNKPDLSIYAESSDLATVATSGSYNDLLDKPSIPSAQVNADWDATSGVSAILNKPNLATVATTGDYSDLQNLPSIPAAQVNSDWSATSGVAQILNKPSIPTATSDLTNDSDFITLSDVPAQVNADWNASSGVSEILNKPTIPSGAQLVPSATSADVNKVLTVNSQGTPAWASSSGGNEVYVTWDDTSAGWSSMWTQVQAALSANKEVYIKDGFCVAEVIGVYDGQVNFRGLSDNHFGSPPKMTYNYYVIQQGFAYKEVHAQYVLPNPSSGSVGQVLGLVSSSDPPYSEPAWVNSSGGGGSQVNSDWDATSGVAEILNKPTPKTLTAGANISISEAANTLTISAAAGLPASTSADEGKCLVVDSNGDPEWGTGGKTYTGTDGVVVDNVNDTVGLEAPVDLVAGPGITVDNPDGNTVRISVNQPARETLLYYSDVDAPGDTQRTYALSESPMNFERIGIFMFRPVSGNWMGYTEFDTAYMQSVNKTSLTVPMAFINNSDHFLGVYGVSGILTSSWADVQGGQMIIGSSYFKGYFAHIYKIIGINRIANN